MTTNTTTKETEATPWKVYGQTNGYWAIRDANGIRIASELTEDQATLIVRAVNRDAAFEALLEACKENSMDISPPRDNMACHNGLTTKEKCGRCQRAAKLYNAIALAEEQS